MSEYIKPQKSIWKMKDGSIWEGPLSELPKSGASLIAKAGKEYPTEMAQRARLGKSGEEEKNLLLSKKAAKKSTRNQSC